MIFSSLWIYMRKIHINNSTLYKCFESFFDIITTIKGPKMNLNQVNKHMVKKLNNHEAFPLHYPHLAPPVCMGCWTKFNSVSRLMKYKYKYNAIQLHIFKSRGAIQWVPGRVKHKAETAVAGLLRLKLGQPWIATTPCSIFASPFPLFWQQAKYVASQASQG